jgi:hypothetical protein
MVLSPMHFLFGLLNVCIYCIHAVDDDAVDAGW